MKWSSIGLFPNPLIKVDVAGCESTKIFFHDVVAKDNRATAKLRHFHSGENVFTLYPELIDLKLRIEEAGCFVYQQLLNHRVDGGMSISSAWFNICQPGGTQVAHSHSNCMLSGTYYLHTDEASEIEFYHPLSATSMHPELFDEPDNRENAFDLNFHKQRVAVPVMAGDCLFWPSQLRHGYQNNRTPDRLSLSFNMMPTKFNATYQVI